jgi:F-type H+-transporting ATPase subunit a
MLPALLAEEGAHHPPLSIFHPIFLAVKDTGFGHFMGFDKYDPAHHVFNGLFWFDAICFTLIGALALMLLGTAAARKGERIPKGLQNLFEFAVELLRKLVHGFIPGPQGDKFVPYLGTLFLFIFIMNLQGILPAWRAPTMTLSTTLALGLTTFVMVQFYAIRETGVGAYLKHFMGDVLWLAPLMFIVEVVGECIKPMSLSLRLYGNIYGEDNVIEQLMTLGGWIPAQLPMLAFAIFTSFLQAFIFTTLSTIYVASKVVHEGGHDHGDEHGHDHAAETHAHGAHH